MLLGLRRLAPLLREFYRGCFLSACAKTAIAQPFYGFGSSGFFSVLCFSVLLFSVLLFAVCRLAGSSATVAFYSGRLQFPDNKRSAATRRFDYPALPSGE
jgi:hypothetical protein